MDIFSQLTIYIDAIRGGNWADPAKAIVEIVMIYLVVYGVMMYVRGTRAAYILLGLFATYLGISIAAYFLDLTAILWVMRQFWGILTLACVMIFQPELRRAFASLGARFYRGRLQEREVLTELTAAAAYLSEHKMGALIVMERTEAVRSVSATGGVVLDCKVSAPLLECIFMNKSPLHDGAVVIRENRIVSAHMILPLAHVESTAYGTRHRAAMGITEETDAVAIVVSEETGAVSVAHEGELIRLSDVRQLTDTVTACLMEPEEEEDEQDFDPEIKQKDLKI